MAWATRAGAAEEIEAALAKSGEAPEPLSELRKNQAFLTPKVGIASPDTWAGIAAVIRNMLLNWLVFLPLLALVLLSPRLVLIGCGIHPAHSQSARIRILGWMALQLCLWDSEFCSLW
jgi:hypothetical protein